MTTPAITPTAWLVTGSDTWRDRVFVEKRFAIDLVSTRFDASQIVPLYRREDIESALTHSEQVPA